MPGPLIGPVRVLRELHPSLKAQVVTDTKRRPEGWRVRHRTFRPSRRAASRSVSGDSGREVPGPSLILCVIPGILVTLTIITTVAFLVWYLLYVVLSNWGGDFMDHKIAGHINVALVFGLLQFVTTFAITGAYVSFANRKLDPKATAIRERLEPSLGPAGGVHGQEN